MKCSILRYIPLCLAAALLLPATLFAKEYTLPPAGDSLVGEISYAPGSEPLVNIGVRYNVGMNALLNANPGVETHSPSVVKVPAEFILPPSARTGIVINLPEMRMYYFPEGSDKVMTFPVGIGRVGKTIPLANTSITRKVVNPTWTPPDDIREFNKAKGVELPHAMGPGPDNPLGPYAVYLKIPTYLIHSTIFPESIGTRASFGCIRMHEDDIKEFFPIITKGIPVAIIDMPNKVGWENNILYLETHPPLEEHKDPNYAGIIGIVDTIERTIKPNEVVFVNWQTVSYLAEQRDGVPHEVGIKLLVS